MANRSVLHQPAVRHTSRRRKEMAAETECLSCRPGSLLPSRTIPVHTIAMYLTCSVHCSSIVNGAKSQ
eukprot:scaffold7479_cov19-Prasinocladus_malaysianus.AAC.1